MILTKKSKIEGSGFESCRPFIVKLFLSNWSVTPRHDFIDFLFTKHLIACFLLAGKIVDSKKVWFKYMYTKKILSG
jgi:hypothetical protein